MCLAQVGGTETLVDMNWMLGVGYSVLGAGWATELRRRTLGCYDI